MKINTFPNHMSLSSQRVPNVIRGKFECLLMKVQTSVKREEKIQPMKFEFICSS